MPWKKIQCVKMMHSFSTSYGSEFNTMFSNFLYNFSYIDEIQIHRMT